MFRGYLAGKDKDMAANIEISETTLTVELSGLSGALALNRKIAVLVTAAKEAGRI